MASRSSRRPADKTTRDLHSNAYTETKMATKVSKLKIFTSWSGAQSEEVGRSRRDRCARNSNMEKYWERCAMSAARWFQARR